MFKNLIGNEELLVILTGDVLYMPMLVIPINAIKVWEFLKMKVVLHGLVWHQICDTYKGVTS